MNEANAIIKRVFDIVISIIALFFLFPVILISWLVASIELKKNGLFFQTRIGKSGIPFKVVKIKTMKNVNGINTTVTSSTDSRISKSGLFFRKTKIDELPQLWNVVKGDMSLVGPRPDVPGFADELIGDDKLILTIRPGITGPASIYYKNEEELLALQADPEHYNKFVIYPHKVLINKKYITDWTLIGDMKIIIKTII
jgi:lipopolysaccharide/colanic/teichoic acid biosynthesis glycosyltransferase